MVAMGVYDQIKKAFQDIVAPELHALRGDLRVVDQRIIALDQKLEQKIDAVDSRLTIRIEALAAQITSFRAEMASLKAELLSEIRRVDNRIDSVDRELRTAIDVRERLAALEARLPA
jgi:chromosome segregation ATPase